MKAIISKYLRPTNCRGSRIQASDEDGNRATVSYNYALSGEAIHRTAALELCRKMDWTGTLAVGELKNGYIYVWVQAACLSYDDDNVFRVSA